MNLICHPPSYFRWSSNGGRIGTCQGDQICGLYHQQRQSRTVTLQFFQTSVFFCRLPVHSQSRLVNVKEVLVHCDGSTTTCGLQWGKVACPTLLSSISTMIHRWTLTEWWIVMLSFIHVDLNWNRFSAESSLMLLIFIDVN